MKFAASLVALFSLAAAAPQAPTPLDVKLEMAGNSAVKATITNNGKTDLKVFKTGTIFDDAAIQKARITREDGNEVPFQGIRQRISAQNLDDAAFEHIPAGQSVAVTFNVGEVHDLSSGGTFNIRSSGIMQFASQNNNQVIGSVPYTSNSIRAEIHGPKAASVHEAFHVSKRSATQRDCTGSKYTASMRALRNCAKLAAMAQSAAQTDSGKLYEYFKSSTARTSYQVALVFNKVAIECGATNGGVSRFYCTDLYNGCSRGVLAYTMPDLGYQIYCDLYFTSLPSVTHTCHSQDQASTTLHEMTHLRAIAETSDYAYGYQDIMTLGTAYALNNAESYSLFANAVLSDC
ncbi:hypothetical protein E4U19_004349 [Claviceps sp. Clav32 group G5]|nr:hypothetical protein E4U19_004349 [Claviceps sp. Clav32 group G5]KAG6032077.1 hypothetical protein E4U40_006586 [Claviceps sp. LM458 group G5]KAG6042640.1 hypothetical protein E4U39_005635 [Claviceps sp. Clav50 group G5]